MAEAERRPGIDRMTDVALARRGHVAGRFAGRCRPIVAVAAATGHAGVIEACRTPGYGRMASVAFCRSRQVISRLAGRAHAVVAGAAGAGRDASMVELRRRPRCRHVAGLAGVGARYVISTFARGN